MTDLLVPIIIVLVMLILIDYFDTWPPLLLTGFLFLPISWLYTYQLRDGLYTEMFGADISGYLTDLIGLEIVLSLIMWFVPMLTFLKLMYIKIDRAETDNKDGF